MSTFSFVQRDQIRTYMGMPKLFAQSNSMLENAISAIENIDDGGATFNAVAQVLVNLQNLDNQLITNSILMLATEVKDEIKFDAIRNDAGIRRVARAQIKQLSIRLSMDAMSDYYAAVSVDPSGSMKMFNDASMS